MKTLIIIPTYNERENIKRLIPEIKKVNKKFHILVVDDNSSDGTVSVVNSFKKKDKTIHLIKRPYKSGLGKAYVDGFRYALKEKYDLIFEMDADFSHDPKYIPDFLKEIKNYDLVIGSRYINGVSVVNWPISRLILSKFANFYARVITGLPLSDCTSGFKCYRRNVIEAIDLNKIHSDGYAFQIEMHYKAWKKGFRIKEIPIIFVDRHSGTSKMSRRVVLEAIIVVWKLRLGLEK
ncbi:MAG: polyprenol monophosphomannose synthase [Candidatus Goldbacteria bacterium]|nr:polyprenol monophosphomannose synthase [Candidatus Goldiibacteriota bacterium]